jgi:uncharacterized protein YigE (DUF2233 family)
MGNAIAQAIASTQNLQNVLEAATQASHVAALSMYPEEPAPVGFYVDLSAVEQDERRGQELSEQH